MAGSVGDGSIRIDFHNRMIEGRPRTIVPGGGADGNAGSPDVAGERGREATALREQAGRIQNDLVAQPQDRARTTEIITLNEFYDFFRKILVFATEVDAKDYTIRFSHEYPPIEAKLPTFTTRLISRRPWAHNGIKELAPRFMQEYPDPESPGDIVQEFQRRQINIIEFICWAKTHKVASDYAEWVEEKFFEYLWALQWGGLSHPVNWMGRGEDIYKLEKEQQLHGCPLTFEIITAKITKKRATTLRRFNQTFGIHVPGIS